MLLGCSNEPNTETGIREVQTMVGEDLGCRRSFTPGELPSTFANSPCSVDPRNGWHSLYSCRPAKADADLQQGLLDIAAGLWDTRIKNWAKSVPDGHTVDFCILHEADAKVNKGLATKAAYLDAMERIRAVFDQMARAGVPQVTSGNVRMTVNMTAWLWEKTAAEVNSYERAFTAADVVTADPYGKGKRSGSACQDGYGTWLGGRTDGTVGGIWEFSTRDTEILPLEDGIAYKKQFIKDFVDYAYNHGYHHVSAFNSTVAGGGPDSGGTSEVQPTFNRQVYADIYSAKIRAYQLGTAAPDIPVIVTPAAGQVFPSGTTGIVISGAADPGALITVLTGAGVVLGTTLATNAGEWTFTRTSQLADGNYRIKATATANGLESLASEERRYTIGGGTPEPPPPTPPTFSERRRGSFLMGSW